MTFGSPIATVFERDEQEMDTEIPVVENTETLGTGDDQTDAGTLVIFMSKASGHNNKERELMQGSGGNRLHG